MISVIISVFPDKLAYTIKIFPIAIPPSTIIIINNENQYQLRSARKCDKSLNFTAIKFGIPEGPRKSWIALLKHNFLTTKKVDLYNEANLQKLNYVMTSKLDHCASLLQYFFRIILLSFR